MRAGKLGAVCRVDEGTGAGDGAGFGLARNDACLGGLAGDLELSLDLLVAEADREGVLGGIITQGRHRSLHGEGNAISGVGQGGGKGGGDQEGRGYQGSKK